MVVYIYYATADGNSISSQLGSFCQGNRYGTERQAVRPVQNHKVTPTWAWLADEYFFKGYKFNQWKQEKSVQLCGIML
jgi:hypothetical protein